jgi:hypothetical protein
MKVEKEIEEERRKDEHKQFNKEADIQLVEKRKLLVDALKEQHEAYKAGEESEKRTGTTDPRVINKAVVADLRVTAIRKAIEITEFKKKHGPDPSRYDPDVRKEYDALESDRKEKLKEMNRYRAGL